MYYPAVHLTFTCFSKIQLEYLLDTFNIYFHPNRADEVLSGFFFFKCLFEGLGIAIQGAQRVMNIQCVPFGKGLKVL